MNTINQTDIFDLWLVKLKDMKAKARILSRIDGAEEGNFGDCAFVGEGGFEMRIHTGPGYRIYFAQEGKTVYLLLLGGDKSSQIKDIKYAKELWHEIKEGA